MSHRGARAGAGALVLGSIVVGAWDVGAAPPSAPAPLAGERLFAAKGCSACHVGPSSNPAFVTGFPPLDAAPRWAGERQVGVSAEDYLAQSIVAPDAFISPVFRSDQAGPSGAMPVLQLTAEEVDSLVSYLLGR